MAKSLLLKEGSFYNKKYVNVFIGSLLGWVVSVVGGMADSIIAGLYLDSNAVSAVGLVTPIGSFLYFLSILISVGIAIMYSTELGAFNVERSRKIAGMGLIASITIGVVIAVLMLIFKDAILGFYGCSGEIMQYASDYYDAYVWIGLLYPPMWLIYNMISFDGDSVTILINDIVIALLNSLLSFILVQKIGVAGLAMGTLLSTIAGFIVLIPHFFKKSNSIHFKFYFSLKDMWESVKLSSASSSTYLYMALLDIIFNKLIIVMYGDIYLPAYTVVNAVINFQGVLACAMGAGAIFTSVAYGENNPNAIKRILKTVLKFGLVLTLIFTAIMAVVSPYWSSLYAITEPEIAAASRFAGLLIPLESILTFFIYSGLVYYPVINRPTEGNILALTYMFLGPILIAAPLGYFIGFNGLSVGFFLTPFFAALVLVVYLAFKKKLNKNMVLPSDTDEEELHLDIKLNVESIVALRDKVGEFLQSESVPEKIVNEIKIILEDTLTYIKDKNNKTVLCECTVLVNHKHVRVITKDNGKVFDITKEADNSLDLRCYVAARLMEQANEKSNTTTISFNRNTYIWER